MSPMFSAGDPRIVFGSDPGLLMPTSTQYRDDDGLFSPFRLPLQADAVPLKFWFSPDYAFDRRILVASSEAIGSRIAVAPDGKVSAGVKRSGVYSCDTESCVQALDLFGGMVKATWADQHTVLVSDGFGLHRSVDDGRSFIPLPLPGAASADDRGLLTTLLTSGPRLFAGVSRDRSSRLYMSDDHGDTWRMLDQHVKGFHHLVALPDGVLLHSPQAGEGIRCSVDDGRTWARACPVRPPMRRR